MIGARQTACGATTAVAADPSFPSSALRSADKSCGPKFSNGETSPRGIIYFLIALAVIALLIWLSRRGEERRSSSDPTGR